MRTLHHPRALLLVPFLLAPSACDDGPAATAAPVAPAEVVKLAGDLQAGPVTEPLPVRLEVQVLDADGAPVPGVALSWSPCGRGGTVAAVDSSTDSMGRARATWVLGTSAGLRSVTARAGSRQAVFNGTALPASPATLEVVAGESQTGPAGAVLPDRIRVRAIDVHGNAVPQAAVVWRVTAGGGRVADAAPLTAYDGVASAEWVLGDPGPQRLEVEVGTAVVVLTATTS